MSSPIGYPQGDSLKAASSGGAPDNQIGQNLIDQAGGYSPVAAQTNPLTGVIEISGVPVAPLVVVADGGSGATSGWIQTSASPERFALELTIATGGAAASLTLDGSNDGQTSAAQIATASLDTTGVQTITPPIKPLYPWIRWTVVFAGSGNVKIARGA